MRGRDDMELQGMEERVCDAFGAATGTVTAADLPGVPAPPGRAWAPRGLWAAWAPRVRMHALTPVVAAVSVAVIAVTASLVVPKLMSGGQAAAGTSSVPAFFTGVAENPPGSLQNLGVNIYQSTTGRVTGFIHPPRKGQELQVVANLGNDHAYVVAGYQHSACTTQLYRFTIDSHGRPGTLTPLAVPQVSGDVEELTASADGKVLAFSASPCARGGQAGVIHLDTGHVTTWQVPQHGTDPVSFGSLSLTADGSTLGFLLGDLRHPDQAWSLPTSAPPGAITSHARKLGLQLRTGLMRMVLNADGSRAYVETATAVNSGRGMIAVYRTANGQRVRVVTSLGPNLGLSLSLDAAGQHMLAYGYHGRGLGAGDKPLRIGNDPFQVAEIDLATGHQTAATASGLFSDGGMTTLAW